MEYINRPLTKEAARKLLALDLTTKELTTYEKLDEWYTAWGGRCYISFSGGKDSTVLAYLAARYLSSFRTPPWELNLVFVNTGLEYPEIQKFVNKYAAWLRKDKNEKRLERLRGELMDKNGKKSPFNCDNWEFLLYAPFLVSSECCRVMKKSTGHRYSTATKQKPILAMMAEEGRMRYQHWLTNGCNAFDGKTPRGKPMSFWTEQDVLRYIVDHNIPYASVYGDIVSSDGENDYGSTLIDCKLHCTGCQRTGCMFCGFGAHLEKGENRFERMKLTHPKHYEFCIGGGAFDTDGLWKPTKDGLGYARVLDYIGVRY